MSGVILPRRRYESIRRNFHNPSSSKHLLLCHNTRANSEYQSQRCHVASTLLRGQATRQADLYQQDCSVQMWKHYRLSALLRARREHYRVHTFRNPPLWLISVVYFLARYYDTSSLQASRISSLCRLLYVPWQSILLFRYFYPLDITKVSNYKILMFSNILMYVNIHWEFIRKFLKTRYAHCEKYRTLEYRIVYDCINFTPP